MRRSSRPWSMGSRHRRRAAVGSRQVSGLAFSGSILPSPQIRAPFQRGSRDARRLDPESDPGATLRRSPPTISWQREVTATPVLESAGRNGYDTAIEHCGCVSRVSGLKGRTLLLVSTADRPLEPRLSLTRTRTKRRSQWSCPRPGRTRSVPDFFRVSHCATVPPDGLCG